VKKMNDSPAVTAAHVRCRHTTADLADLTARRQAAEADAHAQARRAARHLMDIYDAIRPPEHVTLRSEPTMADAVAEIRTRGPQPPLDYVRRDPLYAPAPAPRAAVPVLIAIAFLAGVLTGRSF